MLSSEEEEKSGRKRREEGRGQSRRHQRHMSGEWNFQKVNLDAFCWNITSNDSFGPKWGQVMREGEKPIYEISLLPWNIRFGTGFTKTSNSCKKWPKIAVITRNLEIILHQGTLCNIVGKSELCQDNPFYGLRLYKGSTFIYVGADS